jgi:serine/threonine protein phosphatase PrpC
MPTAAERLAEIHELQAQLEDARKKAQNVGRPDFLMALCAHAVHSGGREYQEDRAVVVEDLNALIPSTTTGVSRSTRRAYYAIYDGHGGHLCSEYLSTHLHLLVAEHPYVGTDPKRALAECWDTVEEDFLAHCRERHLSVSPKKRARTDIRTFLPDGSTAVVCLLVDDELIVCNCGDSLAYVGFVGGAARSRKARKARQKSEKKRRRRKNNACDVKLSTAEAYLVEASATPESAPLRLLCDVHDPDSTEMERVVAAGCALTQAQRAIRRRPPMCCLWRRVRLSGKARVYPGGLNITRSFGDFYAKLPELGGLEGGIVHQFTTIHTYKIDATWGDLVLASDGVWNAFETEVVFEHLDSAKSQHSHGTDEAATLQLATAELVDRATRSEHWSSRGSTPDNASAIVVSFRPAAQGYDSAGLLSTK